MLPFCRTRGPVASSATVIHHLSRTSEEVILSLVTGTPAAGTPAAGTPAAGTPAAGTPAAAGKRWLDYGNFFIVALGLLLASIAFLVALYLLIATKPNTGLITDSNEVLAILTAFFGVDGTLVGAYFAVKTSSDQAVGATNLAANLAGPGAIPLTVVATYPQAGTQVIPAPGGPAITVNATFSKDMNPDTITGSTFILQERDSNTQVPATPSYDPSTKQATLELDRPLNPGTFYKATITTGVRDTSGNPLPAAYTWEFRVG
jgi:Bacterial Ig-like domain